jgi:hypothetical protein
MTVEVEALAVDVLARLLSEKGIRCVAIVDDAFDPLELLNVRPGEMEDLWGQIEFDDPAMEGLRQLGIEVGGVQDLTAAKIARISAGQNGIPALREIWRRSMLGQRLAARADQVERLRANLQGIGLNVLTFGSGEDDATPEALKSAQIIFLDWFLGEDDRDAITTAVQRAKRVYGGWLADEPKPLIVLMSSRSAVVREAEQFRRDSGLLAGIFYAFHKKDLSDLLSLQLHLQVLALSIQFAHKLQNFVEQLRMKVQTVGSDFAEKVAGLTLSDYAHIQRLSLQEDGQPFGDYLLWLLSGYFGHLLFGQALKTERVGLDAVTFADLVPFQAIPSLTLAQMYRYTLFDEDVGPVTNHPRSSQVLAVELTEPLLFLGDVFERTNDDRAELYMIINAQCDLSFAPNAKRQMDPTRSILLLPGQLHPLQEKIPDDQKDFPRTELFTRNEKTFRIFWDTRKLVSVKFENFGKWLSEGSYQRTARLRLPYALEIQRAFSADLNRVGMPVAPPIYQSLDPTFLYARDGKFENWNIEPHERGVFLVLTREGQRCVFTVPLVNALKRGVDERMRAMRDELKQMEESSDQNDVKKLELFAKKFGALERVRNDNAEWLKLLIPHDVPTSTKQTKLLKDYVCLGLNIEEGSDCGEKIVIGIGLTPVRTDPTPSPEPVAPDTNDPATSNTAGTTKGLGLIRRMLQRLG